MNLKALNRFIKVVSFIKIPLLGLCRPKIVGLTTQKSTVFVPLNWMTKNHLGSMYFGALSMGAELSIALEVLRRIQGEKAPVGFVFKTFNAQFLKRADTDVHFCCEEIPAINLLIESCLKGSDRVEGTYRGYGCSATDPENRFMEYELGLSLKKSKNPV